jgi:hypothetical protein
VFRFTKRQWAIGLLFTLLIGIFGVYRGTIFDATQNETSRHLKWVSIFAATNDLEVIDITGDEPEVFRPTYRRIVFMTNDNKLILMDSRFESKSWDVELHSVRVELSEVAVPQVEKRDLAELIKTARNPTKSGSTVQLPVERIRKNEALKLSEFFPDRFPKQPE